MSSDALSGARVGMDLLIARFDGRPEELSLALRRYGEVRVLESRMESLLREATATEAELRRARADLDQMLGIADAPTEPSRPRLTLQRLIAEATLRMKAGAVLTPLQQQALDLVPMAGAASLQEIVAGLYPPEDARSPAKKTAAARKAIEELLKLDLLEHRPRETIYRRTPRGAAVPPRG